MLIGRISSFNSYTSGTPVGMFKPGISSSEILSRYFTSARSEFAVRGDDHPFAIFDCRYDLIYPVRHKPLNGIFQAFCTRHFIDRQVRISPIICGMALITAVHFRWRCVIASPPDVHLFLPEFFCGLRLIQTLKIAVHPFVQSPGAFDRNPF